MDNVAYLISDCARNMRKLFDLRMRANGVTGPQARLMLMVMRKPGQQQGHYAGGLDVEPITLCRMLDRLVDAGLLERREDPQDRRARLVYLTERGERLAGTVARQVETLVEDMLECFGKKERDSLCEKMLRMAQHLEELTGGRETAHG